jgi:hypothetical protein
MYVIPVEIDDRLKCHGEGEKLVEAVARPARPWSAHERLSFLKTSESTRQLSRRIKMLQQEYLCMPLQGS